MNTFQALVELQKIDIPKRELMITYEEIEKERERKNQELEIARQKCDAAQHEQTAAEVKLRRLELERASENQTLSATRDQLFDSNSAPSWRDEQRLQEREQELINRIAKIDEDITPVLEVANSARADLQASQAKLAQLEEEIAENEESSFREQARIISEVEALLEQREAPKAAIPKERYDEYCKLFAENEGRAVATVEREVCGGCSERLSTGELNKLRLAAEPQLCHCGKFLITLDAD